MTNDDTSHNRPDSLARKRYLGILARATTAQLEAARLQLGELADVQYVRPAEVGMSMLRGRVGGTGDAFNLGEATVTRCALRVGNLPLGVGYTLGRERRKAELMALFDSLLQGDERRAFIQKEVVDVLGLRQSASSEASRRAADTSKVEFFTFVRGAT
jgi:alpha-D-ribose 1-methylphosphonate 5-triphosphate synthase subunit PhnG